MPVPLSIHWVPAHRGSIAGKTDRDWFALWDPSFVKVLTDDETVPYLEDVPPAAKIIVRNYPLSELGHDRGFCPTTLGLLDPQPVSTFYDPPLQEGSGRDARGFGSNAPGAFGVTSKERAIIGGLNSTPDSVAKEHAATCNRIAAWCESKGIPRTRLLFEGLNEPMLWSTEPPAKVAQYYRQFLLSLHSFNLRGVAGNFGVGWPGNGGVQDQPVQWDFFKPVIDVMNLSADRPDYLGLHEYWALEGPQQNWRWWAGRYEQCPWDVPILITETGIDTGVTGQWYGGWGDLPGTWDEKARRYVGELAWYWQKCLADGRIKAILPFTYDIGSSHWEKFNLRDEVLLRELLARKAEFPAPTERPITKPIDPSKPEPLPLNVIRENAWREIGIPWNPEAALQKYAREQGLGNPVTLEFDVVNGAKYRAQGFAGGIVYAKVDDWGNCQIVKW